MTHWTRRGRGSLDASNYPDDVPSTDDEQDGRISARATAEVPIDERRQHGTRPVR
jgi:hypothetical protein